MVDNGDLLAVEARDIVKVYNGAVGALDGVSLWRSLPATFTRQVNTSTLWKHTGRIRAVTV